jgi:hypothetical protein
LNDDSEHNSSNEEEQVTNIYLSQLKAKMRYVSGMMSF